ncbi:T9SS type A sorting domain-containing protein [Hymenobacter terrigena]
MSCFRAPFSPLTTLLAFGLLGSLNCQAQVTVVADAAQNGNKAYSVTINAKPKSIYSTNASGCTNGYNYDLVYEYAVTFAGNRPANLYNLQVSFDNTKASGNFTNIALPTAGGSGTATTNRNQYRNTCDYATATPASFGTKVSGVTISGPGISSRTVAYASAPLPVTLVSFSAQPQAGGVALRWATASELNNSYFDVEKSINGTVWNAAYRVAGAGTTSLPRTYEQFDRTTATGQLYYRLKQVDVDGQATYSPVATVKAGLSQAEIQLYPNPNTTNAFSLAGLNGTGPWPLQLRNALGNVVYEASVTTSQVELPLLPAGVYFLRLQEAGTGRWVTTKYIKQ